MHVLVTEGTEALTATTVSVLLSRGHTVRLSSPHAARDAKQWAEGVEPNEEGVLDPERAAALVRGCEAILHLEGILDLSSGEERLDPEAYIEGSRRLLEAAASAGVRRVVLASPMASLRGGDDHTKAHHEVEELVKAWKGAWVICRAGDVYGPNEGRIGLFLKMVRTLPAVPVVTGEGSELWPVWSGDLGRALAMAVDSDALLGETLTLAGDERISINELVDRLSKLTGLSPAHVPVPEVVASIGARLAEFFHVHNPIADITAAAAPPPEDTSAPSSEPAGSALSAIFGIAPMSIDEGLKKLVEVMPEQLPSQGVGVLTQKRFWADIKGAKGTATELFESFCERFGDILPIPVGCEPCAPDVALKEGSTLSLALPIRGHIQVRVHRARDNRVTLLTIEGHPLAGAVNFRFSDRQGGLVRFEVELCDRAATRVDQLMMRALGDRLQNATWRAVVRRVVAASSGKAADGVRCEVTELEGEAACHIEEELEALVLDRKREHAGAELFPAAS
jgi:NADH dehydrogenase